MLRNGDALCVGEGVKGMIGEDRETVYCDGGGEGVNSPATCDALARCGEVAKVSVSLEQLPICDYKHI